MDEDKPDVERENFTEQHHFMIEAAMQMGFKVLDDEELRIFSCTDEQIVTLCIRVAKATIEQLQGGK